MADRPGGHDAPRAAIIAVVVGAVLIAGCLLLLWVDLRHRAALERGAPPPAYVVVGTPTTYGPPRN